MSPPSFSSTVTGKSLNPVAEPWIPKSSPNHPLLPHQFFHTPPPYPYPYPYAAPTLYYYPAAGTKILYNHCFTLSYPQYQNPVLVPKHDGDALEKEVGGGGHKAFVSDKNVLKPPRLLLRDGRKRKPKRIYSAGHKSCGVWIKTSSVVSSSTPRISHHPLSEENNTTVMIKNIPNKLRRDSLMNFLDGYCKDHCLEYDFIYLPIDFKWLDNLGYAFVNFTTASAALLIMDLLNNYKWGGVDPSGCIKGCQQSKKICEVSWAKIQGKKKLVKHFEESSFACHTFDFLPAEFDPPRNGWTTDTKPKSIGKLKPTGPSYPNHLVSRKSRWAIIP